jgi:hypothetical protein
MRISKLEKETNLDKKEVKIKVEILLDENDLTLLDYRGFDMFPDEKVPDLLVAAGRMCKNKIFKDKLRRKILD